MAKSKISLLLTIFVAGFMGCVKNEHMKLTRTENPRQHVYLQNRGKLLPMNITDVGVGQNVGGVGLEKPCILIDAQLVNKIFQDILSKGDSLLGRYFTDGQFAYASAIRRYIEINYRLRCDKIFTYGDLTGISQRYGCCASWKYDVAIVIRTSTDTFVIDPRLFGEAVGVKDWVKGHTHSTACVPHPSLSPMWEIVSGESFTPLDLIPSGYLTDTSYAYTNAMLAYYADSVGCGNSILTSIN